MRIGFSGLVVMAAALLSTGCIKSMLTNGQISATREAAGSFNTIGDYELARSAASAGLVQFEGMLELAPGNEDALFLLTQGWVGYGYAFPEDDWEAASDAGDDELATYHQKRARMAYERGVFYGLQLLKKEGGDGFDQARAHANTLKAWLADRFTDKEDAETLFWVGYAWLARVNIAKDDPVLVADLFVGVEILERANALDPSYMHWGASAALAAYHARSPMAEMEEGRKLFELALEKTQRKSLVVQLNYAHYACTKSDKALYEKLLNEVLAADDPDPSQRLTNMLAKRRAKRWLTKAHEQNECGF